MILEEDIERKIEEIEERNKVKVYNLYPNNVDPNYMKILYRDIEFLISEVKKLRDTLQIIANQSSGIPTSTSRSDCMAALAKAALIYKLVSHT